MVEDMPQWLSSVFAGAPLATVMAVALKVIWAKYQKALEDKEKLHGEFKTLYASQSAIWIKLATGGDSRDHDSSLGVPAIKPRDGS